MSKEIKIVDTENKEKDGTNRCPNCHASDVTYNIKKKKLICNYCYTEFEKEEVEGIEKEAKNLKGETRTTGVKDINKNSSDIITLKCSGCGAEVVINTAENNNARCHWCRSILSINQQIDNGAVPDLVLPFNLSKEEAQKNINDFVSKRRFFANAKFKKEFTTDNIMGVYFPYMLIDANCHAKFIGQGEHQTDEYTVTIEDSKGEEKKETRYDADLYDIDREFDISIDDLTIESNSDKLDKNNKTKTNNVINSIMPFDTENCTKYKANYLEGYTSEKRDINVSNIEEKVNEELRDVTRHSLNNYLKFYDRGISWKEENLIINGKQWMSAYLPVWLYSYQDRKKRLHYVAVNGRSGETMGSVPLSKLKLFLISALIFLLIMFIPLKAEANETVAYIFLISAILSSVFFYVTKSSKYRNKSARHTYEKETKSQMTNMITKDKLNRHETDLSNSSMYDANNKAVYGEKIKVKTEE